MFVYLSKKIAIPNGVKLRSLAWNADQGWIACGGDGGLLKVLKLDSGSGTDKGRAPNNLSMNQTLDGHDGNVTVVGWNENYRKLTSSDSNGLIIVWMLHKGMWFEEMINNRNKSVVRDLRWTTDGQKICIVYEDGAVIVGSVDGNRLWGKELKRQLSHVEWSPDGKYILFGTLLGEVHIYESGVGNYISKVPLSCIEDSSHTAKLVGLHWFDGPDLGIDNRNPSLAICFENGRCQIMRSEADERPILIDTGMKTSNMQWNHNGTVLAIGGVQGAGSAIEKKDVSMIQFYNPNGQHLRTLKVPGSGISAISWEGSGLRIGLAVDSFIYFANVRPEHKWGFFNRCLVYAFHKPERMEQSVVFWNTKTNEKATKYVKRLLHVKASGDNCILVTKTEESTGQHIVILCNEIGSPVDSKYVDMECLFVTMTPTVIVVCSTEIVYVWQYRAQNQVRNDVIDPHFMVGMGITSKKESRERLFHIDEMVFALTQAELHLNDPVVFNNSKLAAKTNDAICAVASSDQYIFIGRESGTVQIYSQPNICLINKMILSFRPYIISPNCTSSKLAVIDINGVLTFYRVGQPEMFSTTPKPAERLNFERKDVWDMAWAKDNEELFAMMEKTRMYIFRGLEPEEPVLSSAYLCTFDKLKIKAVLLDEIMAEPDHPQKEYVLNFETKSLRDTRELLSSVNIADAYQFIEDNPHPRLWKLLAEAALEKMDFNVAEKAFVRCKDYKGIQFVKKLKVLGDKQKQTAEVSIYFKRFDDAERIYKEIDRKDLAVELRVRLGDWFKVVQLVQEGGGDDQLIQEAWNHIGDYYADRQKWSKAVQYYGQAKNYERLVEYHYLLEDYKQMERLIELLPEGSSLLVTLGHKFASVGFCQSAVVAFLKGGEVRLAVDTCVELNQWDTAVKLADANQLPEIPMYLSKYATHLVEKDDICPAVELYRKAGKHLEAAKLLSRLAQRAATAKKGSEEDQRRLLRAKQFHLLAALEMDKHKKKLLDSKQKGKEQKEALMEAVLQQDQAASYDKALENAWKGVEAYHFFCLAQRQLIGNNFENAMITAMRLMEYDDILDELEVYSLIAVVAYYAQNWSACSKAFIRLENIELKNSAAEEEEIQPQLQLSKSLNTIAKATRSKEEEVTYLRSKFQDLALRIFLRHPPNTGPPQPVIECPAVLQRDVCRAKNPEWNSSCFKCGTPLPVCMVTGRVITVQSSWTCKVCRHKAYDHEIYKFKACPLCHSAVV